MADDRGRFAASVQALLVAESVLTLATSGPRGPWAADLFFAADGLSLFFWSSPDSRHGADLIAGSTAAATVHPRPDDWRAIVGLQAEGTARQVDDPLERERARAVYTAKFPFAADLLAGGDDKPGRTSRTRPWVFEPTRLHLVDNSLGFGSRWAADVVAGSLRGPVTKER